MLVENLETTKRTAIEIEEKVRELPRRWCCGATDSRTALPDHSWQLVLSSRLGTA